MSGDGQAVIEQIYQMGVAPGTEAAAAGAWGRAGDGGPMPSTIVATFNGIGFGGVERPSEVVAEWAMAGLPAVGDAIASWEDELQGLGLVGPGVFVEESPVQQAGLVSPLGATRGARILAMDNALTTSAGELLSQRGGVVAVIEVMDITDDGDVISTKPALGGSGTDYLSIDISSGWELGGVTKGDVGSNGVFFIQIDVTASDIRAVFARGVAEQPGGIGSAVESTVSPEFRNGIRFGNNIANSVDFRLYGAAVYHGDENVGAAVLRYMQSRYIYTPAV